MLNPTNDFLTTPLMSFLPHLGDVRELPKLRDSLIARLENVKERKELNRDPHQLRIDSAESRLIIQILDWMGIDANSSIY